MTQVKFRLGKVVLKNLQSLLPKSSFAAVFVLIFYGFSIPPKSSFMFKIVLMAIQQANRIGENARSRRAGWRMSVVIQIRPFRQRDFKAVACQRAWRQHIVVLLRRDKLHLGCPARRPIHRRIDKRMAHGHPVFGKIIFIHQHAIIGKNTTDELPGTAAKKRLFAFRFNGQLVSDKSAEGDFWTRKIFA